MKQMRNLADDNLFCRLKVKAKVDATLRMSKIVFAVKGFIATVESTGVHNVSVWGPACGGYCRAPDPGVGPAEHGLRAAAARVEPQVPDTLHTLLPKQTGLRPLLHRRYVSSVKIEPI